MCEIQKCVFDLHEQIVAELKRIETGPEDILDGAIKGPHMIRVSCFPRMTYKRVKVEVIVFQNGCEAYVGGRRSCYRSDGTFSKAQITRMAKTINQRSLEWVEEQLSRKARGRKHMTEEKLLDELYVMRDKVCGDPHAPLVGIRVELDDDLFLERIKIEAEFETMDKEDAEAILCYLGKFSPYE